MNFSWHCKHFSELTLTQLYNILQLRSEIFVVEQKCIFQDMDGLDQESHHFMAWNNEQLVAYTRLLPPGLSYNEQSIGRVVVEQSQRDTGLGKELMQKSIAKSYELFGKNPIKIGAQLYLSNFYGSFGFIKCSDIYDEDGIDHIKMLLLPH